LKSSSLRFDGGIVAQAIVVISFVGHTLFISDIGPAVFSRIYSWNDLSRSLKVIANGVVRYNMPLPINLPL